MPYPPPHSLFNLILWSHLHRHCTSPDLRFSRSGTTKLLARLTRSDRRRMERRKASGILEKRCGVSGALVRSGRKKFFTANMLIDCNGTFAVVLSSLYFSLWCGCCACWQWKKAKTVCGFFCLFFCYFYHYCVVFVFLLLFTWHVYLFSFNPFLLAPLSRIYLLISCALIVASTTTTILQLVWLCFAFCILTCG